MSAGGTTGYAPPPFCNRCGENHHQTSALCQRPSARQKPPTPAEADSVAHILAIVAALRGSGHAITFAVGDIDDARRYLRRRGLGW